MTDKTPEERAAEYAVKFMAESNLHFDNPVTAHMQSWSAGYAAALPKWVSVDQDNKPMEVIIDGTTYRLVK